MTRPRKRLTLAGKLDAMAAELLDAGYPATASDVYGTVHAGQIRFIVAKHMRAHARAAIARERARRGRGR